jgi:hypothetical protein
MTILPIFQVFQMFHRYIANVVYPCYKSSLRCCTSCNSYTRMFQMFLSIPDVCCKYFYLDVTNIDLDIAYTCLLQTYVSSVSVVSYVCLQMFYLHVAYVCNGLQMFFRRFRKCFRRMFYVFYFFFYIASRLGVAHRMRCGEREGCERPPHGHVARAPMWPHDM